MSSKRTDEEKERQRKFGKRIQRLREEQGLTQGDIKRRSGMDRSFISNLETGIYSIAAARIPDLAQGLRVDTVDLFEEDEAVRNKNEAGTRYIQLVESISKEIADGVLKPGDFLPREPALCKSYGFSSFAVRRALAILRGRGLIRGWSDRHFVASADDLEPIEIGDGDSVVTRMPTPDEMFRYAIPDGVPVIICYRKELPTAAAEVYPADRFYIQGQKH